VKRFIEPILLARRQARANRTQSELNYIESVLRRCPDLLTRKADDRFLSSYDDLLAPVYPNEIGETNGKDG
jgi:hypothetical protein